jgi:ABC-2 type transport system permease protein
LTLRRALRTCIGWGVVFGLTVITNVTGFRGAYPTVASRQMLARTLGHNAGLEALLGTTRRLDTIAGFTGWRTLGIAVFLGSVVGLFMATRLLRGEEEAGRWDLVVAGPTTRRRATLRALGAMRAGLAAMWLVTAVLTMTEFPLGSSLFFAAALISPVALFTAVGALTSQLSDTRRRASSIGGVIFGAFYALRLVADSGSGVAWLRWATPLGWIEELRPLVGSHFLPFLPLAVFIAACAVASVRLADRRDVGAGALPSVDSSAPHTRLLTGPLGLDARLVRPAALGWAASLAAMGWLVGVIAKSAGEATTGSKAFTNAIARLGGRNLGAKTYIGLSYLIIMLILCIVAAGQIGAVREDEATGRVEQFVVGPVGRQRWLSARVLIGIILVVVLGCVAGIATWVGAASQGTGIGVGTLLQSGLNAAPPALFVLGLGTLLFGLMPRLARPAAYAVVAWSFLVELLGSLVKANRWLLDLSLFHHIAPAPASNPIWRTAIVMVVLAAGAVACGTWAFRRRDLELL